MSAREVIVARCISVEKVPSALKVDLTRAVAQHSEVAAENVSVSEVVGYHNDQGYSRLVFLLDSKESADNLAENIKQEVLGKDGQEVVLKYERSTECEIPDDWIKQVEAPAITVGPTVPPRVPHKASHDPGSRGMSTFYQNVSTSQGQPPWLINPGMTPELLQQLQGAVGQGHPGMQGQGQFHAHGQPGAPFLHGPFMPGFPPFPMGPMGPGPQGPQGFTTPSKHGELEQKPPGQGQVPHPNFPWYMPWSGMAPMYPQGQQQDSEQPHSGPPPPYDGADHTQHDSETTEKQVPEDPCLLELKEPITVYDRKGGVSKAVEDQEEYMEKLKKKMQKEQPGDVMDTAGKTMHQSSSFEMIDDDRTTKIVVSGLPETVNEDYLELWFEKLGGSIKSLDISKEENIAVIEFKDPEAVDMVLSKTPIKIAKTTVEVEKYEPPPPAEEIPQCTVRVCGIPRSVNEELLLLYFENAKKSGGDTVETFDYQDGDEEAFLTFAAEEVAQNVVQRDHVLQGTKLEVCLHSPLKSKSDSRQDRGASRQQSTSEEPPKQILIGNLPPNASEEYLAMFFESTKKVGAGAVANVDFIEDGSMAVVEFEEPEAVDTVLSKLPLTMSGQNLEIEIYSPTPDEPVIQDTIEVRGPPDVISSEVLDLYFENKKKSAGGEIIKIKKEGNVAYVTYASEEVAQRVVERGQHKINGKEVEVSIHQPSKSSPKSQISTGEAPEPACIVRVDGVSRVQSLDTLQYYFENSRRSGGGAVKEFEVFKEDDVAYVTFEEEEAARRVAERGEHKVSGETVQVSLIEPLQRSTKSGQDEEEEPLCSIKVTGISKVTSMETMQYYFENTKRSGGGYFKDFVVHEEEDYAYVTFENEDVAKRVANKAHRLNNVDLHVTLYKPPRPRPLYNDRLIIKGVSATTTKDCLFNFLEAKSGASANQLIYGEQDGTVMVIFDSEPDFDTLVKVCERRPLEGSTLTASKVRTSNCILVSDLKPTTSGDTVQNYFENRKRSNGGDIERVKMLEETGTCHVFFQDYAVVDDVIKIKHRLEGQKLTVKIYIEELGRCQDDGSEPRVKIPDSISIENVEEKIVNFIRKNNSCIEAVNKQLDGCYAKVVWPEKGSTIVVKCEITVKTPDYRKLVKNWKSEVEKNLMDYINQLCCEEHPVWDEGWDAVLGGLGEINIQNPDSVALFVDKKDKKIRVVGYRHTVEPVSKMVLKVIKSVSDEIERKKQTVKQTISNLKPLHLRLLLALKYPNEMEKKFPNLKVRINQGKNELVYEGIQTDIQTAKVEMYEEANSFSVRVLENITQNCCDLFQSKQVKDYIVKKLKAQKLVGVWEAVNLKLAVCSYETDLSSCVEFISESVQDKTLQVTKESSTVLTSQLWVDRLNEIHSKNPGFCKVSCKEDFSKVYVTATDDVVDEIYGLVTKFLKQNTVLYETFSIGNQSSRRLIIQHHMDKLSEISKALTTHYVQIQCDGKDITLRGTEEGIQLAKGKLTELINRIEEKEHLITKPGLALHIASNKGQEKIRQVESAHPVIIKVGSDDDDNPFLRTVAQGHYSLGPGIGVRKCAGGDTYGDRKVYTAEGDMSQISVDVIVNSADKALSLSGGLGKVLVTKGGNNIKAECEEYIQKYGDLKEGDVFIGTGGNLPAKFIVHVSSPHWDNGKKKEKETLKDVVFKAMQRASMKKAKSIAIPALGCGNYGFPLRVATGVITNAVKDFFREEQDSSITEVYFVDVKPVTVESFTEAAKDVFDRVRVIPESQRNDGRGSNRPVPIPRGRNIQSGDSSESDDDSGPRAAKGFGNIQVEVIKGEIASVKVDVIVNTTGKNLDLRNGAVSASLLRAGGDTLQQDLTQNYPKGLGDGQIAVSGGGNLKCQHVFHGALMNWDGGDKAILALHQLMESSLQEADKKQMSSIAFPAIGTGQLGFPRDLVAKEMFSAVGNFVKKSPNSSVKEVKFVVYHKDVATVKAFDQEEKNWSDGARRTKRASRFIEPTYPRHKQEKDDEGWVQVPSMNQSVNSDGSVDLYGITITVKQGDITQANNDCIINSSNEDLDLTRGAVAKALLSKGGEKLRQEALSKAYDMKLNQLTITSAPGLPCQHIIHIVAQDNKADWHPVIGKCLQLADVNKIKSIAFPALGTSFNMKPKESAKMVLEAVQNFASKSPQYLKQIDFIIYQDSMMKEFKKALTSFRSSNSSAGKPQSMLQAAWKHVKGGIGVLLGSTQEKGSYQQEDPSSVRFIFYSLHMKDINDAIRKLETIIEHDLLTRHLNDSVIEQLTPDQIRELHAMAEGQHIYLNIQPDKQTISVMGMSDNVLAFSDKIQIFLRDLVRFEAEKKHAELMKNMVQWFFIEVTEVGQNLEKYTPQLNLKIEKAFQDQKPNVQFKDSEGVAYEIDFGTLTEYPVDNKNDIVNVIRKDLIKESGSVDIPPTWASMNQTENLKVVTLQSTDEEYQKIAKQFSTSCSGNYTITKIDRIQNVTLFQQYQAKKKLLEQQNKQGTQNERILWHGTAPEAVDSINAHGFNRSYCGKNATAYGDGVYFAEQASYSCQDVYSKPDPNKIKRMYLCRVLTGEFTMGARGMRVLPQKAGGATHELYDSVVDNVVNPSMYIIFNDTQAYPDYLVAFKQ